MTDREAVETLEQGLELFETVGMPARNLAERTRKEYKSDLVDLIAFLGQQGITRVDQVGLEHLEAYQAEMDRRGYKASTRERKTYAIKGYFAFLHRHKVLDQNVAAKLTPPKREEREPRYLSEAEYQRLLRACSHQARDAAIIEMFLQTGMRLSELAKLTLADVEIPKRITRSPDNMGSVTVTRKGGKVQQIPLNYKACQALAAWLAVRPEVATNALFVTKFKKPMGPRAIHNMVKKYMAEAKIPNASVHTLRHTTATHLIAKGASPKSVQRTLGHKRLDTTAIYIALVKEKQRQDLQQHALG